MSRSGGKDSDVLGDIVKNMGLDIEHIFINTGLEDRSVRIHGEEVADKTVRPDMPFSKVIQKYGYPVISKEVAQCVYELQKSRDKGVEEGKKLFIQNEKVKRRIKKKRRYFK